MELFRADSHEFVEVHAARQTETDGDLVHQPDAHHGFGPEASALAEGVDHRRGEHDGSGRTPLGDMIKFGVEGAAQHAHADPQQQVGDDQRQGDDLEPSDRLPEQVTRNLAIG
jgi:hypothetical protein